MCKSHSESGFSLLGQGMGSLLTVIGRCASQEKSSEQYIMLDQHIARCPLQVGEHFMGRSGQTQRRSLEFQLHARPDAVLDPAPVLQEAGHVVQARCTACACTATQTTAGAP